MSWSVAPAHASHIGRIANRMRPADVAECRALGKEPKAALRAAYAASSLSWTAMLEGRPEAMFGLACHDLMGGVGSPWLLGTEAVPKGARHLVRWGPHFVAAMQREYPRLENAVAAENAPAVRLLEALGFDIETETVVIGGMPFRRFSRVRELCVTPQR